MNMLDAAQDIRERVRTSGTSMRKGQMEQDCDVELSLIMNRTIGNEDQ